MYIPPHFAETRLTELHRFMKENPFAALVTYGPDGLDANHLPFDLDVTKGEHGALLAHVARNNPVWQEIASGSPVMVVFKVAQAYVSPNWYPSKHEFHKQVPTWNYQVVHAHGTLQIHDEERFVRRVVALLTRTHEASEPKPWKMGDSAPEYIDMMVKNIVGIEIPITKLVGKSKLSQNREERDRINAAAELDKRGHGVLASAMRATIET